MLGNLPFDIIGGGRMSLKQAGGDEGRSGSRIFNKLSRIMRSTPFKNAQLSQNPPQDIFVARTAQAVSDLQSTYDRLLRHRKIPDDARISRLAPPYFSSITDLHQSALDHDRLEISRRLSGDSEIVNYCRQTSTLLLLGDQVIGMTLTLSKKTPPLAYIYAVIVEPRRRRTWATAYLKYHSLAHLLSEGFEQVGFQALSGNRDTLKHAKKVGAKIVADNYSWND
jgi:hypothetical protein